MLNNDPHDPNNPQPQLPASGPDVSAQSGYSYSSGSQNMQPGYQQAMTHLPPASGSGVPPWYQPAPPVAQSEWSQPTLPQTSLPQTSGPRKPVRSKTRSAAIFALTCLLALVFGVGLFSGWTFARSNTHTTSPVAGSTSPSTTVSTALGSQSEREAAIAKVMPAVVEVVGQTVQGTALGSGVIVDASGHVVTNNHVVDGTSSLQVVLSSGRSVQAQLVGTDAANDLAVLRIQPYTGMVVAKLGDSSKLTVGQEVLALGNPLGLSGTATSGVVSALNRTAQESRAVQLTGLIRTSAPINPGNSGGALINLQGEVIGIPTLSAVNNETNTPANGIGFAIPSSQVKLALTQVLGS